MIRREPQIRIKLKKIFDEQIIRDEEKRIKERQKKLELIEQNKPKDLKTVFLTYIESAKELTYCLFCGEKKEESHLCPSLYPEWEREFKTTDVDNEDDNLFKEAESNEEEETEDVE